MLYFYMHMLCVVVLDFCLATVGAMYFSVRGFGCALFIFNHISGGVPMKKTVALSLVLIMLILPIFSGCSVINNVLSSTHTITFQDTDGTVLATTKVQHNKKMIFPEDPVKEGYLFNGWKTALSDSDAQSPDLSTPVTKSTTLYASWIEEGYDLSVSYRYTKLSEGVYLTAGLYVYAQAPKPHKIMIRFIEEEIFFSAEYPRNKKYVEGENTTFVLEKEQWQQEESENAFSLYDESINLASDDILNGRVLEAAFVDDDGKIVGNPFIDIRFTEREKEFLSITINDFDEDDTVLNFDQNPDKNFGVLADDVKVIRAESVVTQFEEETNAPIYVITSPKDKLRKGDKVFVNSPDCEIGILCQIQKIDKKGETYTVTPTTTDNSDVAFTLNDFYQCLKVDMYCNVNVATEDEKAAATGQATPALADVATPMAAHTLNSLSASTDRMVLTDGATKAITAEQTALVFEGETAPEASLTLNPLSASTDRVEFLGGATGTATLYLKWKFAPKIFIESYFECDVNLTLALDGHLSAKVKKESAEDDGEPLILKLGKLTFPVSVTGFFAHGDLDFLISYELKAGVEVTWGAEISVGFVYSSYANKAIPYRYISIEGKEIECKGEATLRIGPQPGVGIQFLNGIVDAKIQGFYGLEISGEAKKGDGSVHLCELCVDGTISQVADVTAMLECDFGWTYTPVEVNLIRLEKEIGTFYVSLIADESDFQRFGFGTCPNYNYKRKFAIYIQAPTDRYQYIRNIFVGNNGHGDTTIEWVHSFAREGEYKFNGSYRIELEFNVGRGQLIFDLADISEKEARETGKDVNITNFLPSFTIGFYKRTSTLVAWDYKIPEEYRYRWLGGSTNDKLVWNEKDDEINWDNARVYEDKENEVTILLVPLN